MTIKEGYKYLNSQILFVGRYQYDNRLDRDVEYCIGLQLTLQFTKPTRIRTKYKSDFARIRKSFEHAIKNALLDPTSRRLVCFNTIYFERNYQCFLIIQFLKTHEGYMMVVYQRSADLAKYFDDVNFFMFVANKFSVRMKCNIIGVTIFYAHVHKQAN